MTAEKSLDERDEELIEEIATLAYDMDDEETPPEHTVEMIGAVVPLIAADDEPDRQYTMSVLARLGYFSRMAEGITVEGSAWQSEEITAAIQTCLENPGDAETLGDAMAKCAARFAMREPLAGSTEDMRDEGSLLAEVAGLAHIERLTIGGRMSGASVANEMYELPEDPEEIESVMASEEYQAFAKSDEVSDAATEAIRRSFRLASTRRDPPHRECSCSADAADVDFRHYRERSRYAQGGTGDRGDAHYYGARGRAVDGPR